MNVVQACTSSLCDFLFHKPFATNCRLAVLSPDKMTFQDLLDMYVVVADTFVHVSVKTAQVAWKMTLVFFCLVVFVRC